MASKAGCAARMARRQALVPDGGPTAFRREHVEARPAIGQWALDAAPGCGDILDAALTHLMRHGNGLC
jgi:hypothetical protein